MKSLAQRAHRQLFVDLLDLAGVAVFAISGVLAAERSELDLFGVLVLAAVTAIGGGTLRDLLMRRDVFWLRDVRYLSVILLATSSSVLLNRSAHIPENTLLWADALGLACVAIAGAQVAEDAELPAIIVVVMGTLTGCGGGAVRDILTAHVPIVLRSSIYASAAIAGICAYLALRKARVPRTVAAVSGVATVAALRLCAVTYGWQLPVLHS